jgi:S-methylmethionine-dependent homocysteine/selenocysteine methylase
LADGGLETTLIFHEGVSLPHFAAFTLLGTPEGTEILRRYFERYAEIARGREVGLVLETPTWRANPDWAAKLGYDASQLSLVQRRSVELLLQIRDRFETGLTRIVISGNLGPRGDGYNPSRRMTVAEAQAYHTPQVEDFAETEADMVAAFTMNYTEEAIGIALAAKAAEMPVAISFTTETDGKLPTGETLDEAIEKTDAASQRYPAYYMINCAHPTHLEGAMARKGTWRDRVWGLRANASKRSHAELDESTDLDAGNPEELAWQYRSLQRHFRRLCVVGGCCGTDHRHVEAMSRAWD